MSSDDFKFMRGPKRLSPADGGLAYLSAAAALLTREPEGLEVIVVNALRQAPGASEIWTRWLPISPESSTKLSLGVTLRVSILSPAIQQFVENIGEELSMRLSAHHAEMKLRVEALAVEAPSGSPSLIWSIAYDENWKERARAQAAASKDRARK